MADLKKFAEELVNLTVKEVNELADILKEEYGIEPAAVITSYSIHYTKLYEYQQYKIFFYTLFQNIYKKLGSIVCKLKFIILNLQPQKM